MNLASEKSQHYLQEFIKMFGMAEVKPYSGPIPEETLYDNEPRSIEFGEAIITEDRARVPINYKKGRETLAYLTLKLEKEKGKWKVVFLKPLEGN